jgi:hypothetical protein
MSMVSRWLMAAPLLVTAMLVQSVFSVPTAYSAAGGNDYEIPLTDLKKVEKKKPKKTGTRKHTAKKKADITSQGGPHEMAGATDAPGQPASSSSKTEKHGTEVMEAPDSAHISHEAYSYVIPGKRTILKVVVSREAVQSVRCRFRSKERGGYASVTMAKAPESQFTYVATLPALEPGAAGLRYSFIVADAAGNETYSQEFYIPAKSTSIMPGWQQDSVKEPIRASQVDPRQPLEGFSDVIMENAGKK